MRTFMKVMLVLACVGAINWLLIGLMNFNLVTMIFGVDSFLTNLTYILIGIAGICSLYFLMDHNEEH